MRNKRYEALSARLSALEERVNGLDVRSDSHDADSVRYREDLRKASAELWAAVQENNKAVGQLRGFFMDRFSKVSVVSIQTQITELQLWRQQVQPLLNMIQWTKKESGE